MITKVEAIKKVMEDNGGTATWEIIYQNIKKYYPSADASLDWKSALRGVLYREMYNNKGFKKIGLGIFALIDYQPEDQTEKKKEPERLHSFLEGICIELGNYEKRATYTADSSGYFKDGVFLRDIATLTKLPNFSYEGIVRTAALIDVLWFNRKGYQFPIRAFEVVVSKNTLSEALQRTYQLVHFDVKFHIIGKPEYVVKFEQTMEKEPYNLVAGRYVFQDYQEVIEFYDRRVELERFNILL